MVAMSSRHVRGLVYARPQPAPRQKVCDGSSRARPQCAHSVMVLVLVLVLVAPRSALSQLPIRSGWQAYTLRNPPCSPAGCSVLGARC